MSVDMGMCCRCAVPIENRRYYNVDTTKLDKASSKQELEDLQETLTRINSDRKEESGRYIFM